MTAFERAVAFTLIEEGAPSDDPQDPGGATVFGISRVHHPTIPWPPTREQALVIYRRDYWDALQCDRWAFPMALTLFDSAVNPGAGACIRLAQQVVLTTVDGVLGPDTLRRLAAADPLKFVPEFGVRRLFYYMGRPTWERNRGGWSRRCFRCCVEAIRG